MKRMVAFAMLVMLFFAGDVGTGCGNGSGGSTGSTVPGEATKIRVTVALQGNPDSITTEAARILSSSLTPNELKYLENLDWRLLENGGLFVDPISRKAIWALVPTVRGRGLQAWQLRNRIFGAGVAYAQGHICSPAENVSALVVGAFESAVTTAISFSCIGAAVATGGAGALWCLGAGIVSAAIIIANANCDVNAPDLPPQGNLADPALAANYQVYAGDYTVDTSVATVTSRTTNTGTATSVVTAINTDTESVTQTTTSTIATTDMSTDTYTDTVTGTQTGTVIGGVGSICLQYKTAMAAFYPKLAAADAAYLKCVQVPQCPYPELGLGNCGTAYRDNPDIVLNCSICSGDIDCPHISEYHECISACMVAENALLNACSGSGSACEDEIAYANCVANARVDSVGCFGDCTNLLP